MMITPASRKNADTELGDSDRGVCRKEKRRSDHTDDSKQQRTDADSAGSKGDAPDNKVSGKYQRDGGKSKPCGETDCSKKKAPPERCAEDQ